MTHVAYLKRIVAGARRMWLKTEVMVPPPLILGARACQILGAVGRERIKHCLSGRNVRCS